MKKNLFIGLLLIFSLNSFAQKNVGNYKEIFLTSNDDYDYFFQSSNYSGITRNSDGTLRASVVARGKGEKHGTHIVLTSYINCKTKQLNLNDQGWKSTSPGTVGGAIVKEVCNMS